jgi:hypothetical protein
VPDDFDYLWLDEFIANAPHWSDDDLATARSLLANQRRALSDTNPRDRRNRMNLQQVVDSLEQAIESHGSKE